MTIKDEYFVLLEHLGDTVPVAELHDDQSRGDVVALRHDVDHDLDLALEMAHHEHRLGVRATYFILHTAEYATDPLLAEKCLQLVDYGHEVGLHNNAISPWYRGETDQLGATWAFLDRLRDAGLSVRGTAAHGDKTCYEGKFVNYWIWSELRPGDPMSSEGGMTAEGIVAVDPAYAIPYPPSGQIQRGDGHAMELWSRSMSEVGLEYEAIKVPHDRYWTDSGGSWKRSPDPMGHDLSNGRHQVLVHPIWWRGESRRVVVVSTARCGSKWLANCVETGTAAKGLHEQTFNSPPSEISADTVKRTSSDLRSLQEDLQLTARLIAAAGHEQNRIKSDVVECNVYLGHFLEQLRDTRSEVTVLHVHRSPFEVVKSILRRGWYATLEDYRHPLPGIAGWEGMTRVERACAYWEEANLAMAETVGSSRSAAIEDLFVDVGALESFLSDAQIVVHRRLLERVHGLVVDGSTVMPAGDGPDPSMEAVIASRCSRGLATLERAHATTASDTPSSPEPWVYETILEMRLSIGATRDAMVSMDGPAISIEMVPASGRLCTTKSAHAVLQAGASWAHDDGVGTEDLAGLVAAGEVEYEADPEAIGARLFLISYGQGGDAQLRTHIGTLRCQSGRIRFSEMLQESCRGAALAVHLGSRPGGCKLRLRPIEALIMKLPVGYGDFDPVDLRVVSDSG